MQTLFCSGTNHPYTFNNSYKKTLIKLFLIGNLHLFHFHSKKIFCLLELLLSPPVTYSYVIYTTTSKFALRVSSDYILYPALKKNEFFNH